MGYEACTVCDCVMRRGSEEKCKECYDRYCDDCYWDCVIDGLCEDCEFNQVMDGTENDANEINNRLLRHGGNYNDMSRRMSRIDKIHDRMKKRMVELGDKRYAKK